MAEGGLKKGKRDCVLVSLFLSVRAFWKEGTEWMDGRQSVLEKASRIRRVK